MKSLAASAEPYDVVVIGAGLAGMAASLFAGRRGLRVAQVGNAGALLFSSGLLDLMAVHPIEQLQSWTDPWAAMAAVGRDIPGHPYARLGAADLREAFASVIEALSAAGLPYTLPGEHNVRLVTSLGTIKSTLCMPETMAEGAVAMRERTPTLLVDFRGLREFSARQICQTLKTQWPELRAVTLDYQPAVVGGQAYPAHIARGLELADHRARLVELIRPHLGNAGAVGLPPVLGITQTQAVAADISRRLGVPIFEVPTIPTSVPGLRLAAALEQAVAKHGVRRFVHTRVQRATRCDLGFTLQLQSGMAQVQLLPARSVILATGRFMGQGLVADRTCIREPLFDLPVVQPPTRSLWHRPDLFDVNGHAVNRAGIEVNELFQPLESTRAVLHPRLFAVGTILAHHDWARMKCGAGIAIGSAAAAVSALERELRDTRGARP
jgi:glycerol-3-phosphate dehydrogenase subunit B